MITNQISGLSIKAKCRKQCNETSLYIYIIFMKQLFNMKGHCIRAPPKRGRYWEIHPRSPRDFPRPERFPKGEARPEGNFEGRGKSRGRRGWISQYLPSFVGVRTFSSLSIHLQGWIRKSIPVGREGLTVLKSILPC